MSFTLVAQTVQTTGNLNGATTPSVNTTGATLLVVSLAWYSGSGGFTSGVPTLTDSKGNSWTQRTTTKSSPDTNQSSCLFDSQSPTVGTGHTFTVAGTASYPSISVVAASGPAQVLAENKNSASSNSATSIQPGSVTPTAANGLVITGFNGSGATTASIDSGFTAVYNATSVGASIAGGIAYLIQTAATAVNPTWTTSGSTEMVATILDYIAAPLSALSLNFGANGTTTTVTVTGTNTAWTSGTTFSVAGGTAASVVTNSINVGAQTASITITAGSAVATLTVSNGTDAGTASFYAIAANTPVTDSHLVWSPGNWWGDVQGTIASNNLDGVGSHYAQTTRCGAYLRIAATSGGSGTVALQLDTTPLIGVTAGNCPRIGVRVDSGAFTTTTLVAASTPTSTLSLGTGLAAGAHTFEVDFQGVVLNSSNAMGDRWTNLTVGASVFKVLGVVLDAGSTIAQATAKSKKMLEFGDSRLEGANSAGSSNGAGDQDATLSFGVLLANAFNAEYGLIGSSNQGYEQAGYGNEPNVLSAWNLQAAGITRNFAAFDYITVCFGRNGTTTSTDVKTLLTNLRGAVPGAIIFQLQTYGQDIVSTIAAGFAAYQAATPDPKCFLEDPGANFINALNSNDLIHLNGIRGAPAYASSLIKLMQQSLAPIIRVGTSAGFSS